MASREVYPNAPLRLVTAEFRYPLSPSLARDNALADVAGLIGDRLPIVEPVEGWRLAIGGEVRSRGGSGGYRFLTRDRMVAVTVTPERLAVETTAYRHWEDFRDEWVRLALESLGATLGAIAGVTRVGLRYIDEVRVPGLGLDPADWEPYIAAELLAPALFAAASPVGLMEGIVQVPTGDHQALSLRFGLGEGHVVGGDGPLRLPTVTGTGAYFLLDLDSFWTSPGSLPAFDAPAVLATADRLHEPVGALFERSITDRLRKEVLRVAREHA